MNRTNSVRNLLGLACACLVLAACETNQSGASTSQTSGTTAASSKSGGHLIVHRLPTVDAALLTLTLDGAQVANLELGRTYDAYVSPGRHVLTAVPTPNLSDQAPASVTFTVENGKTYSFTARRRGDNVVLVKE